MVDLLVLAAALSVAPSPPPSAMPQPVLKEIGHVRATAACAELATHANHAIGVALRNDTMLADTISKMRAADLDTNPITRRNSLQALGDLARDMNLQALAADGSIKRLRNIAQTSTDDTQKKELTAFANWLGGAIWRQRKIARDLNGFLAKMDEEDMIKVNDSEANMNAATVGAPNPNLLYSGEQAPQAAIVGVPNARRQVQAGPLSTPLREDYGLDTQRAKLAAEYYELQLPAIVNDEALAADRVIGATSGC